MSEQRNLFGDFGEAYARRSDPETSHIAAATVDANALEGLVLQVVRQYSHGVTAKEAADLLHLQINTINPRFAPLRRKGYIYDCGERRKYNSRVPQIVWKATTAIMGNPIPLPLPPQPPLSLEEQALNEPLVQEFLRVFKGDLLAVKPATESPENSGKSSDGDGTTS